MSFEHFSDISVNQLIGHFVAFCENCQMFIFFIFFDLLLGGGWFGHWHIISFHLRNHLLEMFVDFKGLLLLITWTDEKLAVDGGWCLIVAANKPDWNLQCIGVSNTIKFIVNKSSQNAESSD